MATGWLVGLVDSDVGAEAARLNHEAFSGYWLYENGVPLARMASGVGITLGGIFFGPTPLGVIMVVMGADQIATWIYDITTGTRGPSVTGYLATQLGNFVSNSWAYNNATPLMRIGFGGLDMAWAVKIGFKGANALLSVPMMIIAVDQIFTGLAELRTGERYQSVVEYLGASAARRMGAGEKTSEIIGVLVPGVASLGLGLGGALVVR